MEMTSTSPHECSLLPTNAYEIYTVMSNIYLILPMLLHSYLCCHRYKSALACHPIEFIVSKAEGSNINDHTYSSDSDFINMDYFLKVKVIERIGVNWFQFFNTTA